MLGALKKFFSKSETRETQPRSTSSPAAPPQHGTPAAPRLDTARGPRKAPTTMAPPPAANAAPLAKSPAAPVVDSDTISIPIAVILQNTPKELHGRLAASGGANAKFTISKKVVLEQLPKGAVKIAFGDLRRSTPPNVFITAATHDAKQVDLPLAEILRLLHPDAYSRRAQQARVEVPPEVTDLFGPKGESSAKVRVVGKDPAPAKPAVPGQPPAKAAAAAPAARTAPSPVVGPAPAPMTLSAPTAPLTSAEPVRIIPRSLPPANKPAAAPAPSVAAPAAPSAKAPAGPAIKVVKPVSTASPAPARTLPKTGSPPAPYVPTPVVWARPSAGATPAAPALPALSTEASVFQLPLSQVADNWPEPVREEIARLKLPNPICALSTAEVCAGLKRGRVEYTWAQIRFAIQGAPPEDVASPHAQTVLELPLSALTPLLLDHIRPVPQNPQAQTATHITEYFRKAHNELLGTAVPTPPAPARPLAAAPPVAVPETEAVPEATVSEAGASTGIVAPFSDSGALVLPLTLLCRSWPDAVAREINSRNLSAGYVGLPSESLDLALRTGKIEFTWGDICSWFRPEAIPTGAAAADLALQLPLDVIAPLYFQQKPSASAQSRSTAADQIPDLFASNQAGAVPASLDSAPASSPVVAPPASSPPEPTPAPAAASRNAPPATATVPSNSRPGGTTFYRPAPAAPSVPIEAIATKPPATLGELFGQPNKTDWTPAEIVHQVVRLQGMKGALIALQDGLLVASSLPDSSRAETTAAFLPQVFGRLNQYAREMQIGELQAISFHTERGVWQVFHAGFVYFAVLTQPGETPLAAELKLITRELSTQSA